MIRDGRDIPSGASLEFDVCVVGAGPAGLALAEALLASGLRIGLLESGGASPGAVDRGLGGGKRSGQPYFRLQRARTSAIGGSSWQWATGWPAEGGLRSRRLDADDFMVRPHVPGSGWPFGPEELDPWYAEAEARSGLAPSGEQETGLGHGLESAVCSFGPAGAFQTAEAFQARDNGTLLTHSTVTAMTAGTDGKAVESASIATPGGGWFTVRARQFVLAGGGIENARLLLSSPFGSPGGIANPAGQVGRNFMEHLHIESGELRLAEGTAFDPKLFERSIVNGMPVLRLFRLDSATQRERGLLNTTAELRRRDPLFFSPGVRSLAEVAWAVSERQTPPALASHLAAVARDPLDVAKAVGRRAVSRRELEGDAFALVLTAEQAPNPRSRVVLDSRKDRFGRPLAHVHWELAPLDLANVRGTQDALDSALRALGVGRVVHRWGEDGPEPYVHGCKHHIGTTRMSATPETGVVDANCRVHGLTNLFIAGSSVMPTGGAITVTLTAVALALRLADHLAPHN